ncbi:hypothetical protein A5320_20120 [Rheinheimera sp. SA_1]|uniref:metallophosphoesterase n=1 Tax=Rheinheimera sp. SA_1 TaxID=1827365 RepID=UPI000800D33F|nr:metallophosphoesterase [Rheinheimera sp. SA_1]OBP13150.1 hypothetical protein A5320_20120 [Rheinheimera sp. SA_1]
MKMLKWTCGFVLLLLVLVIVWLSQAAVVQTQSGVYHSILLPLPGDGAIRLRSHASGLAKMPKAVALQGPVVWPAATEEPLTKEPINNVSTVRWFCDQQKQQQQLPAEIKELNLNCLKQSIRLQWYPASQTAVQDWQNMEQPTKVLISSDLEGRLDYFLQWGKETGLLDAAGNWQYGDGHLVIAGDSVDRGRQVHDLLWTLYQLQQQARAAGGELHLLLGNHEQYLLRGVVKDVEAEHLWATEQFAKEYKQAFAADTVLGHWLRQQPLLLKLNRTLYLHGGISETLLASGLDISQINQLHRDLLSREVQDEASYDLLFSRSSPTQFRGMAVVPGNDQLVSQQHVDRVRQVFDVDYLVVGHTQAQALTATYNGAVYLVENTGAKAESLQFVAGQPKIITTQTLKPEHHYPDQTRRFSLLDTQDWGAFIAVWLVPLRSTTL